MQLRVVTVKFSPNPFRNLDDTMPSSITVPNQNGGGQTASGNPNNGSCCWEPAAISST